MKIKSILKTMTAMLFAVMTLTSCSESDVLTGDWDSMEWDTQVKVENDGTIAVPASGGTYVFTCLNYGPWLSSVEENGTKYCAGFILNGDQEPIKTPENTMFDISGEYSTASINKCDVTVTIAPNTGDSERKISVSVTAGDIFDGFNFVQAVK